MNYLGAALGFEQRLGFESLKLSPLIGVLELVS
jgi:hypothetical protein